VAAVVLVTRPQAVRGERDRAIEPIRGRRPVLVKNLPPIAVGRGLCDEPEHRPRGDCPARRTCLEVHAHDLPGGFEIDGLIGLSFLKQFDSTIRSLEGRILVERAAE
jgi:hypothetical protein